eukprot:gene8162-34439_t
MAAVVALRMQRGARPAPGRTTKILKHRQRGYGKGRGPEAPEGGEGTNEAKLLAELTAATGSNPALRSNPVDSAGRAAAAKERKEKIKERKGVQKAKREEGSVPSPTEAESVRLGVRLSKAIDAGDTAAAEALLPAAEAALSQLLPPVWEAGVLHLDRFNWRIVANLAQRIAMATTAVHSFALNKGFKGLVDEARCIAPGTNGTVVVVDYDGDALCQLDGIDGEHHLFASDFD